jgi:tetratricopeptide (TPR) repeat protein
VGQKEHHAAAAELRSLAGAIITMTGQELYYKGREAMEAGDLRQAISSFRESAELEPHFKTFELLGECFLKSNQPLQAIAPLQSATAMNTSVRAVSLLGEAFYLVGRHTEAEQCANEALRRDANNRKAQEIRGTLST